MKKKKLSDVTVVAVSSIKISQTIQALKKSYKYIDFNKVLLISHKRPLFLNRKISYLPCDKISSSDQYSYFMLYQLSKYIDTSHVLVIQHDGYVINPESWSDEFLKYDYIGAPWPDCFLNPSGEMRRVGNGGFSLRSRKLLEIPSKINIPFKAKSCNSLNEDLLIALDYHDVFESEGCNFAPIEVAARFSHEIDLPELSGIKPFGFHGYYNQKALSKKQKKEIERAKYTIGQDINRKLEESIRYIKRFIKHFIGWK